MRGQDYSYLRTDEEIARFLRSANSPLQDHVVMLFAEPIPMATGADSATGIFLGGWDFHENKAPDTARMLVFLYPVERSEAAPQASG